MEVLFLALHGDVACFFCMHTHTGAGGVLLFHLQQESISHVQTQTLSVTHSCSSLCTIQLSALPEFNSSRAGKQLHRLEKHTGDWLATNCINILPPFIPLPLKCLCSALPFSAGFLNGNSR